MEESGGREWIDDRQAGDVSKVIGVPGDQRQAVGEGGGGDDRVAEAHRALLAQGDGRLDDALGQLEFQ